MSKVSNFQIEKIQSTEIDEVALILTDAFETNPAYSLIFNHTDLREGLFWLFRANLLLLNRHHTLTRVIKEKESGHIIGTFTLVPPEGVKNTLGDYLKIGLPRFLCRFGIPVLNRMLGLDRCNKKALTQSLQSQEYYYLSMVVVKESYRGTGIGSCAIKSCLDELLQTKRECRLLGLTTQLPENVSFYSRLGFEMIGEGKIGFKGNHYYNYNMKYILI